MARQIPHSPETQFKPGESGNPAGMPKGILHSKTIIRKWLQAVQSAKNPINGVFETLSQLDIITLKQLEKARKGDTQAFKELLDRMEGRSKETVQHEGNPELPVIFKLDAKFSKGD